VSCSGCTKTDGCEANKGPQRTLIDATLEAVYPTRTWGAPDDEARFGAGVSPGEVRRLQRALSAVTRAPTFYRSGGPEDLCDYVYILCFGREPALIDVRDGLQPIPDGDQLRERYLRVCFSTVGRMACVQEVAMELDADGDERILREVPQPGVYDPTLLKRMRAVVDLIEASDIEHLDFGMVDKPVPDGQPGDYLERYGVEPTIANFLFYPQPARTVVTTMLIAAGERVQRRVAP
jgi:hypothetical protein